MALRAFKDSADGVYQVDIAEGETVPSWLSGMVEMAEAEVAVAFPALPFRSFSPTTNGDARNARQRTAIDTKAKKLLKAGNTEAALRLIVERA